MLKLFKRQKSQRRSSNDIAADVGNSTDIDSASKRNSALRSTTSFCDEIFLEKLTAEESSHARSLDSCSSSSLNNFAGSCVGADDEIFKYHSRLSMSLSTIVNEPNCLSYLVQFLETKNALQLIKFYLDVENFKTAAIIQLDEEKYSVVDEEADELQMDGVEGVERTIVDRQTLLSNKLSNEIGEKSNTIEHNSDNNERTNVPETMTTLCDLSMRKPLTDDEKSQIYAATNMQLIKCNNNNNTNHKNKMNTHTHVNKMKANSELSICSAASEYDIISSEQTDDKRLINAVSIKDAIAIYQKFLIADAAQFVELPISILAQISLLLCERRTDNEFKPLICASCFDEARDYVLQQLESNFMQDFLQSSFYCQYCVELIETDSSSQTATPLNIYDILYSEATLFYFMEYLEQHQERSCLDFWSAAINFRKSYAKNCESEAFDEMQSDAMIIYEKFFSLQADCRLWLSDKLRCRVEQSICDTAHVANAFDLPLQVTARYLECKYLVDFTKSQLFENYLNELKTKSNGTVVDDDDTAEQPQHKAMTKATATTTSTHKLSMRRAPKLSTQTRHRKSMSDCPSDIQRGFISQHNTLLASMDTTAMTKHESLNIDAGQLTNPHLLWQRPLSAPNTTSNSGGGGAGLKFGRVNSLGRYERDFEAVDAAMLKNTHNWSLSVSGNKLKNAMRKLVNLPEDKVQEEIAWQVAEMIVKDVTSVTLKNEKPAPH